MSVEETECELQQLVSSDEENFPLNIDNATPPNSNLKNSEIVLKTPTLRKVASDHSYRSSKVIKHKFRNKKVILDIECYFGSLGKI